MAGAGPEGILREIMIIDVSIKKKIMPYTFFSIYKKVMSLCYDLSISFLIKKGESHVISSLYLRNYGL